jgi:phosphoglycolate phosphatase
MSSLIFDFDGTIADSFDVAQSIFYELTGHEPITDPDVIAHLRTLPLLKAAREMHISPTLLPRLLIKGRALMHQRIDKVKSFPGMAQVLHELHSDNDIFIMSSNSQPNVESFVREHKLEECFDGIYGGIGLFSKARALRKVIRHNKLDSKDCFYIGDEVRDINAAKRARVQGVGVAWGYNDVIALKNEKPYAVVKNPEELLSLFLNTDK